MAAALIASLTVLAAPGAYVATDSAVPSGDGGLYPAAAAVLVALIGGTVALLTSRRRDEPQSVRYVDAPTSNALPAAMAELYEHVKDELEVTKIERDLWRRRAIQAGWDE